MAGYLLPFPYVPVALKTQNDWLLNRAPRPPPSVNPALPQSWSWTPKQELWEMSSVKTLSLWYLPPSNPNTGYNTMSILLTKH